MGVVFLLASNLVVFAGVFLPGLGEAFAK